MDKQQIKARFFGAHIGCQFLDWHNELTELTGIERHPDRDGRWNLHFFDEKNNCHGTCKDGLAGCRLVLRPLPYITPDEATECANLMFDDTRADGEWLADKVINNEMNNTWAYMDRCTNAIDYLRSRNFCVPFMGLDPIAEGWAILEEKIPAKRTIPIKCTKIGCNSSGKVSSDECEIPETAVSAIETCPRHKKDGDIGSDLKFFDSAGNIVY